MSVCDSTEFFLVWNENGYPPKFQHETLHSATQEAERLARANRGQRFYILRALELRVVDDMKRVVLGDGIPF
jgi:hypothetical protein